eukprot:76942-Alexandrium_andersonii.AAC.1
MDQAAGDIVAPEQVIAGLSVAQAAFRPLNEGETREALAEHCKTAVAALEVEVEPKVLMLLSPTHKQR